MTEYIVAKKYKNEISIIREVASLANSIDDTVIVDILISLQNRVSHEDISKNFNLSLSQISRIENIFNISSLSFKKLKEEFLKSKFDSEEELIEYLEFKDKSRDYKLSNINLCDLFNRKFVNESIDNIISILLGSSIKSLSKENSSYSLVKLRLANEEAFKLTGHYLKHFREFKECYVKVMAPLISIYSTDTLEEIVTTKLDFVEFKAI